jgi:hypothetical protein
MQHLKTFFPGFFSRGLAVIGFKPPILKFEVNGSDNGATVADQQSKFKKRKAAQHCSQILD